MNHFLKNWSLGAGMSEDAIRSALATLRCSLPIDHQQFLREHNGGEGFIGDNYLILWRAEELETFNREYEVELYAPGLFLFGSNGGGEGYAYDTRNVAMPVIRVPFVGMDLLDITPVAAGFADLFVQLEK